MGDRKGIYGDSRKVEVINESGNHYKLTVEDLRVRLQSALTRQMQ